MGHSGCYLRIGRLYGTQILTVLQRPGFYPGLFFVQSLRDARRAEPARFSLESASIGTTEVVPFPIRTVSWERGFG